ncbi:MAG TPA: acyl-CoA dehydrogenase family protein [Polyangiaceae bacterium]|nr:acyl-CoA dehydrogenase family protein [Polyangiaceae bacterium]
MTPLTLDDLSELEGLLSAEERAIQGSVRRFVRERFMPHAAECFERERFPRELVSELAELGLLGASLSGHGCAGLSAVQYGLALQELEYGDSGLRSFVSVQGSLAMYAIHAFGSDEQRARFLPGLARGELIGCFGLTEPDSGSDPGSMRTQARRDGSDFLLTGTKMWITNAPIADVAVVWAKVDGGGAGSIRGFLVERGMAGFETPRIEGKLSLRASETGQLVLDGCRVPESHLLPLSQGLKSPFACLDQARRGVAWGATGAAKACFESACGYARERRQFGVPIAQKQLIQAELADMASEIVKADLLNLHFSRLEDARPGGIRPEQVSLCKRNNVAMALDVARRCRAILGANGILLEYPVMRHALNLESVYTYEGTHEIHTLVLGRALTGEAAF